MSRPTHEDSRPGRSRFWREISATRVIVSTLGVLIAVGGMDHGLFEVLQGNKPTGGLVVHAIGEQNRMWAYGTEDAFTLIPNFLITGVAAIVVSVLIMVWSVGFVHKKQHGFSSSLNLAVPGWQRRRASRVFYFGLGGLDPYRQTADLLASGLP